MTSVVLFHSALGLRPAVHRFADALRDEGHRVTTPDLYGGAVFDDVESGVAKRDEIGATHLLHRARASVEHMPTDLVYAGFSLGATPAQLLATSRSGARGVVTIHGVLPLSRLDVDRWPEGLPIQVHTSPDDPWVDASALSGLAAPGLLEHHSYPGTAHLFSDDEHADYAPGAASDMLDRVRAFLARLGA